MWASFTRVRVHPSKADEAIELVRRHLIPDFVDREGSLQGYWMLDRRSGTGLVVTCWADRAALDASRSGGGSTRARVIEQLDALLAETGTYAVHALAGASAPIDGGHVWSRVMLVEHLDPVVLEGEGGLFAAIHEQLATRPGFLSLCWLVDRDSGNGMSISTWRTQDDVRASEADGGRLRREASQALGCRIEEVVDVETIGTARCGADGDFLDLRDQDLAASPPASSTPSPG